MNRVQGSRTGVRSSTRTGVRTPSRSASSETTKTEAPRPREVKQPEKRPRPPIPKGPPKTAVQSEEERRRINAEKRKATLALVAEAEYEERSKIRVGRIDATMLRFVTREELEGNTVAVCEINNPKIDLSAVSFAGTLYDLAMGPYDKVNSCDTCKNVGTNCPGHFGKILFKRKDEDGNLVPNPIFNTMFINVLIKVLNCICSDCAHLLIPAEEARNLGILNATRLNRLRKYEEYSRKVKQCTQTDICGVHRPYIKHKSDQNLIVRLKNRNKEDVEPYYPMMVYDILKNVSTEDYKTLGFASSRPEDTLILFGILVTPPITRVPRVIGNEYQTDDITERYRNIIVASNDVLNSKFPSEYRKPPNERTEEYERRNVYIQKHFYQESKSLTEKVMSIMRPSSAAGSKRPIANLKTLISGKHGIFRGILNAKVGDFCARSVASPGINLEVDQVGVPNSWASKLTPRENVFQGVDADGKIFGNLGRLQQLLEEGKVPRVERKGNILTITPPQTQGENRFILQSGDVVYRFLQDNDRVLVNRNPSLHKQSILYLRAKLIPGLSLQIPLATTPGYNADFDGDEMNIFMVQNVIASSEAQMIMSANESLLSESSGSALIAPTFNAPLGIYILTSPRVQLKMENFLDVFYATRPDPGARSSGFLVGLESFLERCHKYNVNPLSGKSVFSIILPPNLNYEFKTKPVKNFLHYEAKIKYKNGRERIVTSTDDQIISSNFAKEELAKLRAKFGTELIRESYEFDYKTVSTPYFKKTFSEGEGDEREVIISIVETVEDTIVIREGILIKGTLGKSSIGVGGDLLTYFYREFKSEASLQLINSIDFLANWFLQSQYAFSIGIDDVFDVETVQRHKSKFEAELQKVFHKVEAVAKPLRSELEEAKRQANIVDLLSKINELSFTLTTGADSGYPVSNIRSAIQSGAKGKAENLAGSLMSIGLQLQKGEIIGPAYGQTRYSPFFPDNVYTAESLGYCTSSLSEGFTPAEALPIAAAARGDLATMKLGTPQAGYIQRKLTSLMGNLVSNAKGGVNIGVEANAPLIQVFYGDCCFEAKNLYRVSTSRGEFLSPINMKQLALQ